MKRTHEQARASHLAQQARRDALARIRAGETVSIHLVSGETVQVRPVGEGEVLTQKRVLFLHNNRLVAEHVHNKDCELGIDGRRLHYSDVLGVIEE